MLLTRLPAILIRLDIGTSSLDLSLGPVKLGLNLGLSFDEFGSDFGETRLDVCFDFFEIGLGLNDGKFAIV